MSQTNDEKQGVTFGLLAYVMWGIAPIYFKFIDMVPAPEILVHRILWSFLLMVVLIVAIKKVDAFLAILRNKRTLLILLGSATLLSFNWGMFIWAVNSDHILDASLGYYINPLLNVLLGVVFLGERLRKFQAFAFGLAATGVLIQIVSFGSFPIISLSLALSFAFYGLIRKTITVDSMTGLLFESLVMVPFALIYWLYFADSSSANMINNDWQLNAFLIGTSLVTTLPLLCFVAAARRVKLSTLGFLQYIGPCLMFFIALYGYGEEVGNDRWITFGFIWSALAIFTWDSLRTYRKTLKTPASS